MAEDAILETGCRLFDRVRSASQLHEIDTRKACERMVCEEISRGFTEHEIIEHMIKGGLIHPQVLRQTSDLDIVFGRRLSSAEIHRAFEKMKPGLEAKGIILESYSKTPDPLWIDGNMGERYHLVIKLGKTRVNTHVDISGGTHLFPRFYNGPRHGSVFYKGQEPLLGHYQPIESQAADKLMAITLRHDTTRWKDFWDLAMLYDMQLDPRLISAEVTHGLRRKAASDADLLAMLPEVPEALSYDFAAAQGIRWQNWATKNKVAGDWEETLVKARHLYAGIRERVLTAFQTGPRIERAPRRLSAEMKERIAERGENVVELAAWRDKSHGYRPRGL